MDSPSHGLHADKVIYSDIDPVTVQIGRDIIGENPIVKYETCNAANWPVCVFRQIKRGIKTTDYADGADCFISFSPSATICQVVHGNL